MRFTCLIVWAFLCFLLSNDLKIDTNKIKDKFSNMSKKNFKFSLCKYFGNLFLKNSLSSIQPLIKAGKDLKQVQNKLLTSSLKKCMNNLNYEKAAKLMRKGKSYVESKYKEYIDDSILSESSLSLIELDDEEKALLEQYSKEDKDDFESGNEHDMKESDFENRSRQSFTGSIIDFVQKNKLVSFLILIMIFVLLFLLYLIYKAYKINNPRKRKQK